MEQIIEFVRQAACFTELPPDRNKGAVIQPQHTAGFIPKKTSCQQPQIRVTQAAAFRQIQLIGRIVDRSVKGFVVHGKGLGLFLVVSGGLPIVRKLPYQFQKPLKQLELLIASKAFDLLQYIFFKARRKRHIFDKTFRNMFLHQLRAFAFLFLIRAGGADQPSGDLRNSGAAAGIETAMISDRMDHVFPVGIFCRFLRLAVRRIGSDDEPREPCIYKVKLFWRFFATDFIKDCCDISESEFHYFLYVLPFKLRYVLPLSSSKRGTFSPAKQNSSPQTPADNTA